MRGSDESAHNGHEVVVQHEALSAQSPARVGVEHSDNHRHVSTFYRNACNKYAESTP